MRTILALLLVVSTLACRTAPKPAPALNDIDAFAANVVRTIPEVPSIALAIVHDGRRHARAFGFADVEKRVPATVQTGYYIGSTTKAFTGLTAAILAERGKIDLDAPIATYLPELKFSAPIDAQQVTLRRLLSHTALIDNQPVVFRTAFSGDHTSAALLEVLAQSKTRKEGFRYDNLGYIVAGLAFERVTGRTWQQLHDELVFTPLGMNRTTAYMSEAQRAALAMPYEILSSGRPELLHYRKNDQMMHAAGGTVTTPDDLARWLEANLNAGRVDGRQVIPADAMAEIQRKQSAPEPRGAFAGQSYGFGWYEGTHGGEPLVYHGGGFEGWRALFSFMPRKKIGVGVLTNAGFGNPITQLVTQYAYDRLLGKPNVESEYAEKLTKLRAELDAKRTATVAETERRAQRQSQLKHANAAYVGRYEHPLFGAMQIEERDGKLYASMGAMRAPLEPFTEPETARVELIPANGEVLRFVFSNGAMPDAVKFREELFARKP